MVEGDDMSWRKLWKKFADKEYTKYDKDKKKNVPRNINIKLYAIDFCGYNIKRCIQLIEREDGIFLEFYTDKCKNNKLIKKFKITIGDKNECSKHD